MSIKILASVLAAALLMTGVVAGVDQLRPDQPVATQPPAASVMTAEEAEAIALAHAGLTADQVTRLRAEFEVDDGVKEYEVEFRAGDHEYDYTIHAETGEILRHDRDYDPTDNRPTETTPPATQPAAGTITAEEAKAIALAHAGLTADQVTRLRADYDVDDGVKEYDVEFHAGGWEYEYEIHAETGKILKADKDRED